MKLKRVYLDECCAFLPFNFILSCAKFKKGPSVSSFNASLYFLELDLIIKPSTSIKQIHDKLRGARTTLRLNPIYGKSILIAKRIGEKIPIITNRKTSHL